jgi:hypothetical protein
MELEKTPAQSKMIAMIVFVNNLIILFILNSNQESKLLLIYPVTLD